MPILDDINKAVSDCETSRCETASTPDRSGPRDIFVNAFRLEHFRKLMRFFIAIVGAFSILCMISLANADVSKDVELRDTLEGFGFTDIQLEECRVEFSRNVEPTAENNMFERFTVVLHLDTFNFSVPIKYFKDSAGNETNYGATIVTSDRYRDKFYKTVLFRIWAKKNFPKAGWPYRHPKFHNEFTSTLERAFQQKVPEFEDFNLWIAYAKYGPSSEPLEQFTMAFDNRHDVTKLMSSLKSYADKNSCNDEK